MKSNYLLKTIFILGMVVIFSVSTSSAQTISGEVKITEKSNLSQKPHKNKKIKTRKKKNGKRGKKKSHHPKKKNTKQQASPSGQPNAAQGGTPFKK